MVRVSLSPLSLALALCLTGTACPDWSAFGDGPGNGQGDDDDDDDGGEGEGEGEAGEGEGEGEFPAGPLWGVVDVGVAAQAELAFGDARRLSSFGGRLFAVGNEHIFELVDESLQTVATLEVPCAGVELTGPVAVAGTDVLVGTIGGAVRFHDDGSCEPEYAVSTTFARGSVASLGGNALVYDTQTLTLVDADGAVVDTHAFESSTQGDFYADGVDAVLLVRHFGTSPGQVVRVTVSADELIIAPVADAAMMMAGDVPVTIGLAGRFGAVYLDVTLDAGGADPTTAELRVSEGDSLLAFSADENGEIAGVGTSALVAIGDVNAPALAIESVTGERFGGLERFVVSPSGELWAVGPQSILYWSAAAAAARALPTIIDVDQIVSSNGPLRAIDGALFFSGESRQLQRADVDGDRLQIVEVVDSVSFSPVTVDSFSRFAFVPAAGGAPDRLVEATRFSIRVFELGDDLGSVTAVLESDISNILFNTPAAIAILDDGTKAAFLISSTLYVCGMELAAGTAPAVTCDGGRSAGVFGSSGEITIVDPSAGVDDETYVVAVPGGVGIVEPGESGRVVNIATDGSAPALLVKGCVLGFSSSERSWSAHNPDQPDAPAGRRGFGASDAVLLGDSVLVMGPDDGRAGQLAHFPAPAASTCKDEGGAPVLAGTALFGGEVRSQSDLVASAFVAGELYVLDEDGLVWHVPTP